MKFIRELFTLDLRNIHRADMERVVLSRIAETKDRAEELAIKLEYPTNSRRGEQFDVDYRYSYFERITPQRAEINYKEMINESIRTGLPVLYTYFIDGETDENGMKITIDNP